MREIRFRGKRVDNGDFVYGCLYYFNYESNPKNKVRCFIAPINQVAYANSEVVEEWEVTPESVGEFTGLRDKNGKEIYEDDILDITSELLTNFGKTRTGQYDTTYKLVKWFDDEWGYKVLRSKSIVVGSNQKGLIVPAKWGVVIGNVHDNPELLTIEKQTSTHVG